MNLYIKWGFMAAYFTHYNVCKSYLCCGLYGYFVYSYHQIIFNYILFPSVLADSVYNTALKMLLEGFTNQLITVSSSTKPKILCYTLSYLMTVTIYISYSFMT